MGLGVSGAQYTATTSRKIRQSLSDTHRNRPLTKMLIY